MDELLYVSGAFGSAVRQPGKWGFTYYLPHHLPRTLELDAGTVLALSEADSALGHLQGLGQLIRDPDLLIGPFVTREAVASSRIEGTRASLSEVLQAEQIPPGKNSDDIDEVLRYLEASQRAFELVKTLPVTQRLICEVHKVLMSGVRGEEKQPGMLRKSPVWIGSGTHSLEEARYVAPIPDHIPDLLSDWEVFVNEPGSMPVLIRCALMHYQFETIHPFLDGNGRIGRLLVGLMLVNEKRLTNPLLYLSGYLENNRSEYYERLQAVREHGKIQDWLKFFLRAIKEQSLDAISRAGRIVELREKYLTQSQADRSRVSAIIPLIFRNPFITVQSIRSVIQITDQGARDLLARAERYGWISKYGSVGRAGRTLWIAPEIFRVIEDSLSYATSTDEKERD